MFLDGLRAHIQLGVTNNDMCTLADIKAAALRAEHLESVRKEEHQAWQEEKKRKVDTHPSLLLPRPQTRRDTHPSQAHFSASITSKDN